MEAVPLLLPFTGAGAPGRAAKNQAAASLRRAGPASAHRGRGKGFMRFEGGKCEHEAGLHQGCAKCQLVRVLLTPTFAEGGGVRGTTVPTAPLFAKEISTCLKSHLAYNYVQKQTGNIK